MGTSSIYQQRRIIATSALVTFGVGIFSGIAKGNDLPTARFIIGIGLAYTVCSIFTDLGSGIGAGFALLIMVAALMREGDEAFSLLLKRSSGVRHEIKTRAKTASSLAASGVKPKRKDRH